MNQPGVHWWFQSTTGLAVMSHNGSASRSGQLGTVTAFHTAYDQGYRWFQVDALPSKAGLISRHAIFGRKWGYDKKDREAIAQALPDVPTLHELLTDPKMGDAYWNIEMKSAKGTDSLLRLFSVLKHEGKDLSTMMLSSPMRPGVLKAVAAKFPEVALAAPVVHGGVFGVRFLGSRRATTPKGAYDCQQCFYRFVRSARTTGRRPLRQAWTIGNTKTLDKALTAKAQPIVDSRTLTIRRRLDDEAPPIIGKSRTPDPTTMKVDVLALGGGGWRGAFGGIGAVMYFDDAGEWQNIKDVVGISGGSFAVAALSGRPEGMDPKAADEAPEVTPTDAMKQLLDRLSVASRRTARIITVGAVLAILLAIAVRAIAMMWWDSNRALAVVFVALVVLSSSFLARLFASVRWTSIVKMVYGKQMMRAKRGPSGRSFAIGATGLNDGTLYSFTSDPDAEKEMWLKDRTLATPLGRRQLAYAVVRATSLPGLGQLGVGKIYPNCKHAGTRHSKTCEWVPDKLVDGGLSGIFGRQLVRVKPHDASVEPLVVIVDAGRTLVVNNDGTLKDRLTGMGERASALVLLARWLKVSLEVGYRDELKRVEDGRVADGFRYRLVRLAEEEMHPGRDEEGFSRRRNNDLNRLYVLRDVVHSFSLLKSSKTNSNRAIVVAIAACALEREYEPDLDHILERIGQRLGRGHDLADVWREIRVPLLGVPGTQLLELGPEEVRRADAIDERPRLTEMVNESS